MAQGCVRAGRHKNLIQDSQVRFSGEILVCRSSLPQSANHLLPPTHTISCPPAQYFSSVSWPKSRSFVHSCPYAMQAPSSSGGNLFEYNARYKILICRQCQYAVQKTAIESHLLRHKIYRGHRRRLLSSISRLELLEPDRVTLPTADSPPLGILPVLPGFCCTAAECRYLAATHKRMRRHWTEVHHLDASVPLSSSYVRAVRLQTFFRGNKNRYFEVAFSHPTSVESADDADDAPDDGDDRANRLDDPSGAANLPSHLRSQPKSAIGSVSTDFDLETLTYFHHFLITTSVSLPISLDARTREHYWQTHAVSYALQHRWLMCGLLAISAQHLAVRSHETTAREDHHNRSNRLKLDFSAEMARIAGRIDPEMTETEKEIMQIGQQIERLIRCAHWAFSGVTSGPEIPNGSPSSSSSPLLSIISIIRSFANSSLVLVDSWSHASSHTPQDTTHIISTSGHGQSSSSSSSTALLPLRNRLATLPSTMAEYLGRPHDIQDVFATMSAIKLLAEYHDNMVNMVNVNTNTITITTLWQSTINWPSNTTPHFTHMLAHHHPASLILTAYWTTMFVDPLERAGCWFLRGTARNITASIVRHLLLLSRSGNAAYKLVEDLEGFVPSSTSTSTSASTVG